MSVRAQRLLWALLIGTHLSAVVCSRGYFQFDEHYQVLELIQWKLGLAPTAQMPWELGAKMRPWLHPLLFFPLEWLSAQGLDWSPLLKTTLHRGCVALLALAVIRQRTRRRPQLLGLYAGLFFFPFLDVRLSSEAIGGWLFALGYELDDAGDEQPSALHSLGCGLLFGLAAVIRLHVLALLGGLCLFHLRRRAFRRAILLGVGVVPAFGIAALCDRWGYGVFTFVPFNYVYENIILRKAVRFGSGATPCWYYGAALLKQTGYLPGAIMLATLAWQWLRRPLAKLSFVSLPFVVLHCAVAHKELRYLFPLAPFLPDVLLGLWEDTRRYAAARVLAAAFVGLSLLLLPVAALHDADAEIGLYAELIRHPPAPHTLLQYRNNPDPLAPWGLHPTYYLGRLGLRTRRLNVARVPWHGLLMVDSLELWARLRAERRCQLLASRYPRLVLDAWPGWLPADRGPWLKLWSLWRCP